MDLAHELAHELARPERDGLVALSSLLRVALGRGKRRQEGQCPYPSSPRNRHKQHQADPAQPVHFDEVAAAGTHRVSLDARSDDLLAAPAFNGLIDA
jgi:hypothetical protein